MPPSKTKSKMADGNKRLVCVACRLYNVTRQLTTNQIKSWGVGRKEGRTDKQRNKMATDVSDTSPSSISDK